MLGQPIRLFILIPRAHHDLVAVLEEADSQGFSDIA
jgi:hypothetical protein